MEKKKAMTNDERTEIFFDMLSENKTLEEIKRETGILADFLNNEPIGDLTEEEAKEKKVKIVAGELYSSEKIYHFNNYKILTRILNYDSMYYS